MLIAGVLIAISGQRRTADGRLISASAQGATGPAAVTEYEYDAGGRLTAIVDPEDRRTEFTYDDLGRLVETVDADDKSWPTAYDAKGRVISTTDPTGRAVTFEYDAADHLVSRTDAGDDETTYAYDDAGRLASVTDPLDQVTEYEYDWLGRLTQVTDALSNVTSFAYDSANDLTSTTNARSKTTSFEYDAAHRLTNVIDALLGETTYEYDLAGRMVSRENARGHAETFAYDAAGRPTAVIDPLSNSWSTVYDALGRIDHTIDAEGQQTDFDYDPLGRLVTISPDTGSNITFTYDSTGRRLSMADGNGTTSYDYDPIGRLTESIRGGRTVAYSYDGAGRLNSVDYPGSLGSVALDYDAEGRLDEITDWDSRVTSFAYDGLDRITSITRPGDLLSSFAYDALGRVTGIDHEYDGSPVMELGYEYDAVGNVVERTDDQGAASFTYDDLDRLTVADYPGSDDYSYAYDAVGNLTSITNPSGTSTHTYDAADRISDTGFVYDDNGALTSDGVRSFTYDALGRLVGVTGPSLSAAYTFDGEGNRLSETVNSVTTAFDLDVRGLPTVLVAGDKSYLPGMPSLGYETSSGWLGTLADAQGSVLQTIDSAGVTSALVRYDPYGNARPGSTAVSGIGYTGEWADPAALVNLRFRAYDPSLGRFLSQDSFAGSLPVPLTGNRNAYALGNPIRNEDPSGHFVATAAAWSLDTATEWVAQQCNVTNLWSCFVNFSLAPGLGGLSGAADALAGAVTRRTDAALAILGRSVPSLGSTLKANYIRGFGGLLDDLLKGGAKLLGRTSAILSGVFTAADQWGVDADRDAGSRLFRAGAKGVLAGGAGLVVGGLFATACAPTVVLALACGAVGGIVGSVAGGLVADAGLAVADYASPRVDNAVRLAQDALGSIQAAVSPHLDNGLNAIQGVVADIFQW